MDVADTETGETSSQDAMPVRVIRADHVPQEALADLWLGLERYDLWTTFAFHEIRQRFRRSLLGPFWLTASMGVFVGALGLISTTLFKQDVHLTLPYIATGIIFWGFLTSAITEGANCFISREGYIRNVPLPVSVHLYQMLMRNLIIWLFNMAIYVVVLLVFGVNPGWAALLFLVGGPLFLINAAWMGLVAGILSTRFRDIPQVIASLLQVVFFLTPIFWSTATLPNRPAFIAYNPFYHLLSIVRDPLIGEIPPTESWLAATAFALAGCLLAARLYRRAQPRIAYWV
jgi:ABC-type polysaccharide/polyol phosphate export permease